jgi:HEAT repeat protein
VFWLGQVASDRATAGLKEMVGDENTEVKKAAVFALSQMKTENSINALMDLARNSKDREVRKSALFWLGQSNDPRALALFEEILLKN